MIIFQNIKFISVSLDSGQHSTHIPKCGNYKAFRWSLRKFTVIFNMELQQ